MKTRLGYLLAGFFVGLGRGLERIMQKRGI